MKLSERAARSDYKFTTLIGRIFLTALALPRRRMFSPVSISWLVCQQDCTKTTARLSTKLGWRIEPSPRVKPARDF